jgi:4-diphosphocytidyl-2-C-methyl-D-erythritol kinase
VTTLKEKAYAKINLFLNIVGKRFDGYHDLEMVMAALDLHDELSFKANETGEIVVTSNLPITEKMEDNIVFRVAKVLQEEFGVTKGATIHIEKNIPIAGGLAGGSADAAATFRGLNRLWKLKLTKDDMVKLSSNIGADIPFCIYNKLCIAKGKGEDLFFLDKNFHAYVLLVNPNIEIQTKDVFQQVNEEDLVERKITNMTNAIYNDNYELVVRELFNALEPISFEIAPEIRSIKNMLIDEGIRAVLMTGSGSTVFALSKSKKKLKEVQCKIDKKYKSILTKIR